MPSRRSTSAATRTSSSTCWPARCWTLQRGMAGTAPCSGAWTKPVITSVNVPNSAAAQLFPICTCNQGSSSLTLDKATHIVIKCLGTKT